MNSLLIIQFSDRQDFQLARNLFNKFWLPDTYTINEVTMKFLFEYPAESQKVEIELAFQTAWIQNYTFEII